MSVDLDYNFIGQVECEKMLADKPQVESDSSNLMRKAGAVVGKFLALEPDEN